MHQMRIKLRGQKKRFKIAIIAVLIFSACLLTYYFHAILRTGAVFTHFFYIPIILASLWWKRNGLWVAVFLSAWLICSHFIFREDALTANDYFRVLFFMLVSLAVAALSERMAKTEEMLRETRGYLNNLFNYTNVPTIVWDKAFRILRINHAFENLTGYTANDLLGKETHILFPEKTRHDLLREMGRTLEGEKWESIEIPILTAKGDIRTALWNSANIYAEDGTTLLAIIAQGTDITKRKQAEEALVESEERFRLHFENVSDIIYSTSPDHRILNISPSVQRVLGYAPVELIGRPFADLHILTEKSLKTAISNITRILAGERIDSCEYEFIAKNGMRKIGEVSSAPLYRDNKVVSIISVARDITDRKRAEEEKARIDGRLQNKVTELSITNEISEVLLSTRELGEILHMILIGATAHQALGFNRAFLFLINDEANALKGEVATGSLSAEEAYQIWSRLSYENVTLKELLKSRHGELSKEDEPINNLVKTMRIPLTEGESIFTQAIYGKQSFNIVDGIHNPLIDRDVIKLLGTDTFALVPLISKGKALGVLLADNFINKKPIGDEDVERLRSFANHASLAIENSHLYKSLNEKLEELGNAYNELREKRDELVRHERLSAVGKVAAGITHEIRNPLVSIGGFARRILKKDKDGEINKNYVKIIIEEINRLEDTLSEILYFTKPAFPRLEAVELNKIITNNFKVLGAELEKNNIRVEKQLDPNLPVLWLDENQIRRVLNNLIRNAMQAMPEGGTITVSTIHEQQWVNIEIADTGVGIKEDDMDKLFDAFFTSKSTGSGLGLTISAQIINNHGGTIEAKKREPKGSMFTIKLPVKKHVEVEPR